MWAMRLSYTPLLDATFPLPDQAVRCGEKSETPSGWQGRLQLKSLELWLRETPGLPFPGGALRGYSYTTNAQLNWRVVRLPPS